MFKNKKFYLTFLIFSFLIVIFNFFIRHAETQTRQVELKYAQEKSYQRIFPESVSPKPDTIKARDAREAMEEELKRQEQLSETEQKELTPTKRPIAGKPTKLHYRIAVNDKLYISVWRVPDLSMEVVVGPDGKISFPLIGDIDAAGKTLSELDAEITEKLKEYVNNPQVSVIVREFAGDRVTVIGEVKSPGIYKFSGKARLMDIIALANGFSDRAKTSSVLIVREPQELENETKLFVVDIKSILKGNLEKNIEVEPDDIIYVSRTFISNVQEFYDNWITPLISTVIDYETYKSIRRSRHR